MQAKNDRHHTFVQKLLEFIANLIEKNI